MYNKEVNKVLELKLKNLPSSSGVYFHKNKSGEIIYVGKAAVLKNRVKQYFQNSKYMDIKTKALVLEIFDTDWVETDSEIDALFLEAEMVKRYMPKYNILLRDDRSLIFIRIDMKSEWPFVSFTRSPADDGADYFGPYYNGFAVKKALRFLRRIFPYYTKPYKQDSKTDLDYHLGLSPKGMKSDEYKTNLRKLVSYIKGNRKSIISDLKNDMKIYASSHDYENAAVVRNKIYNLNELQQRIMFGDKEFIDISKDHALNDLTELFGLPKIPTRIEGFDISHTSGTNVVASMVVFKNGASDRSSYRKFKTLFDKNDDFYNMKEIITRRFSQKNIKNWGKPDLVIIDGGKGQLSIVNQSLNESSWDGITCIGLAKRDEQIVTQNIKINQEKLAELGGYITKSDGFNLINIPKSTHIIKLLQRIRDESHRFAVNYHTVLKRKKQTVGLLDGIPGIGPKTRSKLIRKFGSITGLKNASESSITSLIGAVKAKTLFFYIKEL